MTQLDPHAQSATSVGPPGVAIGALVAGLAGFCVPLAGVAAIILGCIGLKPARERNAGTGMAIAGIVLGAFTTLLMLVTVPLMIALLLPALAQARTAARQASVQITAAEIARTIDAARASGTEAPPLGTDYVALLSPTLSPSTWSDPFRADDPAQPLFLLVYRPASSTGILADAPRWPSLIVTNPNLDARGQRGAVLISTVVDMADAGVRRLPTSELVELLRDPELRTYAPDGRPRSPSPQ